jgi:alkylated DNA repair dioxygenase AlkB
MRRIELASGAWLALDEHWLAPDEADRALVELLRELSWEQRHIVLFGKRILQPRLIAWAGELPYRYSGQTLEPRAWPALVRTLLARVNEASSGGFNHVLVNRYRDGKDSMGYHADAEPELGPDPLVATLSFGATRRFLVRRQHPTPRLSGDPRPLRDPPVALLLGHGSLLVMGGTCQRHYRHGVPREASEQVGERVSLTFRRLLAAPASRANS